MARVVCSDVSPDWQLLLAGDQSGSVTAFRVPPSSGAAVPHAADSTGARCSLLCNKMIDKTAQEN